MITSLENSPYTRYKIKASLDSVYDSYIPKSCLNKISSYKAAEYPVPLSFNLMALGLRDAGIKIYSLNKERANVKNCSLYNKFNRNDFSQIEWKSTYAYKLDLRYLSFDSDLMEHLLDNDIDDLSI